MKIKTDKNYLMKMFITIALFLIAILAFSNSVPILEVSAEAHYDPYDNDGKRIDNHDKLEDMTIFPRHDGNNGCGMVAMGVLLQFYRDINTHNDRRYISDAWYYNTVESETDNQKIARANLLRNDLTGRTPKFLGTIGTWVGAGNATVPSGQTAGLNSYLNAYYPNLGVSASYLDLFPSESAIVSKLDSGIPVILTAMYYDYYDSNGNKINTGSKEEYHAMVAYGYKYVNGKIRYLCHMGWTPGSNNTSENTHTARWVAATSSVLEPFIYGFCYINAPLSRFITRKVFEYNSIAIDGVNYNIENEDLIIPDNFNGIPVTHIGSYAFYENEDLISVSVPSSVISIGESAFQDCINVTSLSLSYGLQTIGATAFSRCQSTDISIPSSVTSIGEMAFVLSGITNASIPNGVSRLEYGTFALCGNLKTVTVAASGNLTYIDDSVFMYCVNLTNVKLSNKVNKIGNYAFSDCNSLTNITIPDVSNIGDSAFINCSNLTIYTARGSGITWSSSWNSSNRPVVWACTLSENYVKSFEKSSVNPSTMNGINNPTRSSYSFGGWYTTSDFSGTQYSSLSSAPNGNLYAKWTSNSSCVAEGTLITLADGSQKAIEDLTGDELLLVWNMLTGTFDFAPILFIDKDLLADFEIIHLYFSDGTSVKVIYEHAFWDFDLNKYVFIRNDAANYIGHWFNKQTLDISGNMTWTAVQLIDVQIYIEQTTAWSPVTFGHLCYYVNGMLSMPGATEGLINIFEVDAITMQYDNLAFLADIETYGLFTYEEFAEIAPIPEIVFEAFGGQFLKVSIGKGLITWEDIFALLERYAPFF